MWKTYLNEESWNCECVRVVHLFLPKKSQFKTVFTGKSDNKYENYLIVNSVNIEILLKTNILTEIFAILQNLLIHITRK